MNQDTCNRESRWTRRDFLRASAAAGSMPLVPAAFAVCAETAPGPAAGSKLAFASKEKEFSFDTGSLRGTLRSQGKSLGLTPVVESASGTPIAGTTYGLFSHYRLLDAEARYGTAAWDWASRPRLLPDGAVEARWPADGEHPFEMKAVYRWTAPGTLDVATAVTARKDLRRLEVFLASYFKGFTASYVYVKDSPKTGGKPGFLPAIKSSGDWQMFPRDGAVGMILDGRWKRPPNPVDWAIMPPLAAPLAMRRHAKTGLAGLVMAPMDDCFAVSTPFGEDPHSSLYLSLLGRDLKDGETATARSRLIVASGISDERAVALYEAYLKGLHNEK